MILGKNKSLKHSLIVGGREGGAPGESDYGGWGGGTGDTSGTGLGPAGGLAGTGGYSGDMSLNASQSYARARDMEEAAKAINSIDDMDAAKDIAEAIDKAKAVTGLTAMEILGRVVKSGLAITSKNPIGIIKGIAGITSSYKEHKDKISSELDSLVETVAKDNPNVDKAALKEALSGFRSGSYKSGAFSDTDERGGGMVAGAQGNFGAASEYINSLPSDTQNLIKNTLTNLQPHYEGIENPLSETGTPSDPSSKTFWNEFKTEFFSDTNNAKDLMQEHADYISGSAKKYTDTIEGKGDISPFKFSLAGQDVSFVPRVNREVAKSVFDVAPAKSPSVGKLSYLDSLMAPSELEEQKRKTDVIANLDATQAANAYNLGLGNLDVAKERLEQESPGWMSYLGAGTDLINTLWGEEGIFN